MHKAYSSWILLPGLPDTIFTGKQIPLLLVSHLQMTFYNFKLCFTKDIFWIPLTLIVAVLVGVNGMSFLRYIQQVFILHEEEHFLYQQHVHLRGQKLTTHLREAPTVPMLFPLIARCELFTNMTVPTNLVEYTWPTYCQSQNNKSFKTIKHICV